MVDSIVCWRFYRQVCTRVLPYHQPVTRFMISYKHSCSYFQSTFSWSKIYPCYMWYLRRQWDVVLVFTRLKLSAWLD